MTCRKVKLNIFKLQNGGRRDSIEGERAQALKYNMENERCDYS